MNFFVRAAIATLLAYLASTIKNPNSRKAQRARAVVEEVRDACDEFLDAVPAPGDVIVHAQDR